MCLNFAHMKNESVGIISSLLMVCLTSCSTGAKREFVDAGGGLATVSALVVALPLIPVAGVVGLASLAGPEAKRERAAARELQTLLDPVYEKRTVMIRQRNPVLDVRDAIKIGPVGFLPESQYGVTFPGLKPIEHRSDFKFGQDNYAVVQGNEVARYLDELLGRDPLHRQHFRVNYSSAIYRTFKRASNEYRAAFNLEVLRLGAAASLPPAK